MKEQTTRWIFWATVGAVTASIWAIDTWTALCVRDWVFGQTGAAWVQAVGSIAAIAFALKIARDQSSEQHANALTQLRAQRELDRERAGEALAELVYGAERAVRTVNIYAGTRELILQWPQRGPGFVPLLDDLISALLAIELGTLPAPAIRIAMNARQMVRQYAENLRNGLQAIQWTDADATRFASAQANAEVQLRLTLEALRPLLPTWPMPEEKPLAEFR